MDCFKTLLAEASAEIIEKKSRFIARAAPVSSENEAVAFIERIRKENGDASHNVFAYRAGTGSVYEKYSDGGEPSGTAGLPALSVLRKSGVTNAAVVITRFFGGILLGAGGLVRAYQASCRAGIDAARVVTMRSAQVFSVTVPYGFDGKLQRDAPARGYVILDALYAQDVGFTVRVPLADSDGFAAFAADMTNGAAVIVKKEIVFVPDAGGGAP